MTRLLSRRSLLAAALAASASLVGVGGCAAPTLPIPPPSLNALSAPDADGFVTVSGTVRPDAYVFVLNENRDSGVITRADGTGMFSVRISAATGDVLTIWQMVGGSNSQLVDRIVP